MDFKLKKSELNFRVYAVDAKPTAAGVDNDIAVITSVPMPNWIMSPDKPSGTPRSDGDVWIQYSVSGNTFNALKNNTMMIATISAWQYVDGAWVSVKAMSYIDGEWVTRIKYLYNEGDECTDITGGWTTWTPSTKSTETKTDEYFGITAISTYAAAGITNPVDVTEYSTLKAIIYSENTKQSSYDKFFISRTKDSGDKHDSQIELASTVIPNGNNEIEIDISNITGYAYVGICDYSAYLKAIKKCWLE